MHMSVGQHSQPMSSGGFQFWYWR